MIDTENIIRKITNSIGKEHVSEAEIWLRIKQLCTSELHAFMPDTPQKNLTQLAYEILEKHSLSNAMPTGFKDLDQQLKGFFAEELVVVGGRPAMGKTLFLISLALNMSKTYPTLYLSYDLSEYRLIIKILSALSGVEGHHIANHQLTEYEKARLEQIEPLTNYQLTINAEPHKTVDMLLEYCTKEVEKRGIKIIMIDFLQLLNFNRYRHYNRDAEIDEICRKLKEFAKQHKVCIVAASSLNRSVENRSGIDGKLPLLSDLRDSGSIEQFADKVLFLYRPEYYKIHEDGYGNSLSGILEVIVAKNTVGPTGDIRLLFNGTQITDLQDLTDDSVDDFVKDRLIELGIEDSKNPPF
ncbi:MAG: DnaB-like helicase C-terminal domain-containing protein [Dysgonamonadaceae bacterium]|jgi:replicative DNA helicase|nr:DnaB-like helicase C-terminal domain-containing protein [Dysgonamonadaceae bacterium]